MLERYDLVVFDWDGTLMDSIGRIIESVNFAADKLGYEAPSEQAVRDIIGLSLEVAIKKLFPGADADQIQQTRLAYKEFYHTKSHETLPLFPLAKELLLELHAGNKQLAVATGKGRPGLEIAMSASDTAHLFHFSRTADEAQSKPSPDMLLQIMAESGISPDRAIMIGDSVHDMEMARAAGMDRIGVSFGAHHETILNQASPLAVIDCYSELLP